MVKRNFYSLKSNSILRAGSQSVNDMAQLILEQRFYWEADSGLFEDSEDGGDIFLRNFC
jgi:hypothetical protein